MVDTAAEMRGDDYHDMMVCLEESSDYFDALDNDSTLHWLHQRRDSNIEEVITGRDFNFNAESLQYHEPQSDSLHELPDELLDYVPPLPLPLPLPLQPMIDIYFEFDADQVMMHHDIQVHDWTKNEE
jgi:hypothetical protein